MAASERPGCVRNMTELQELLGTRAQDLTWMQMSLRALIVFVVTLVYLRVANKRFLGRYTAFDAVLAIILGSVISRGVNGSAPFGPTMIASAVLLALHWIVSALSMSSVSFSTVVKGRPKLLVDRGRLRIDAMRSCHISAEDLLEDLRYEAHVGSIEEVETAYLECNGKISVVRRQEAARESRIRLR
jgi:uncharacterized membrane protein YcaP (DUF421 family)